MKPAPHALVLPRAFTWVAFDGTFAGKVPRSPTALAEALKAGEEAALAEVQRRHEPLVARLARKYGFQPFEAADLLQEVLVAVWEKRRKLPDEEAALFRFISRMVVNAAYSYLRRRRVQRRYFVHDQDTPGRPSSPSSPSSEQVLLAGDDDRLARDLLEVVRTFLEENPELASYYDAGYRRALAQEEIARELGVSRKVVRNRLLWINEKLQALWGARR